MGAFDPADYSFLGLSNRGQPLGPVTSLAYLVGLVESVGNPILQIDTAKFTLAYLYDAEEQTEDASDLLDIQARTLPNGYYPQTPVMLTKAWSPIGEILEQGIAPLALRRSSSHRAVATGVWAPTVLGKWVSIGDCVTQEALFWAIFREAGRRARERQLLVSVVVTPGWSYEHPGVLPRWDEGDIAKADRILWKRTPVR